MTRLSSSLQGLYLAAARAPRDEGARRVLADALQEAGDPRGEFIALQLEGRPLKRTRLRIQRLLDRHRDAFLGPLKSRLTVGSDEWDRGFLVAGELALDGSLADEPSLAFLERVRLSSESGVPAELAGPWMRQLEVVEGLAEAGAALVFGSPAPLGLRQVMLDGPEPDVWAADTLALVAAGQSVPLLQHLGLKLVQLDVDRQRWLFGSPLLRRLRTLELESREWTPDVIGLQHALREAGGKLSQVVLHAVFLELRLKRAGGWTSLMVRPRRDTTAGLNTLLRLLEQLEADTLTSLEVQTEVPVSGAHLQALRQTVRKFKKLELLVLPARR
jgi:uncharacterized protein (TIGR02996 family)